MLISEAVRRLANLEREFTNAAAAIYSFNLCGLNVSLIIQALTRCLSLTFFNDQQQHLADPRLTAISTGTPFAFIIIMVAPRTTQVAIA